ERNAPMRRELVEVERPVVRGDPEQPRQQTRARAAPEVVEVAKPPPVDLPAEAGTGESVLEDDAKRDLRRPAVEDDEAEFATWADPADASVLSHDLLLGFAHVLNPARAVGRLIMSRAAPCGWQWRPRAPCSLRAACVVHG